MLERMHEMKIITFEGIDGTGKSVQMDRLSQSLRARGLSVSTLSFPRYDTYFGGYVGRYLTGKDGIRADAVDGKSMALWFALDRFETFRTSPPPEADVLLINRYALSNAVYQSIRDVDAGQPDILDFVTTLEYTHFGIPRPDLELVLDVDPGDAAKNVEKKGYREYVGNEKDVYEKADSIQARARARYLSFAERLPNVTVIPCMEDGALLPIDVIAARILAAVEPVL